jgi:hypothetical protein|tara:strand:- start:12155 stop:12763 length:609 start_codon:yes stop_codon:yes gene_type:complete
MKRNYHTNLAFLDVLFNTLLCFAALFALSFILINPSKAEKNVEMKAEFVIVVTWPKDLDNDVDVYLEDPAGNLVSFSRREDGLMHLDRDDLGRRNDFIQTPAGPVEYPENREIITIRGTIPGEYVLNVHMYNKHSPEPVTPVTVLVDKINPYSTVLVKTVELKEKGDEKTVCRFVVDKEGKITDVSYLFKALTNSKPPRFGL